MHSALDDAARAAERSLPAGLDPMLLRVVTGSSAIAALSAVRALEHGEELDWTQMADELSASMTRLLSPYEPDADVRRCADLVVFGMTAFWSAIQAAALHQTPA